MLDPRPAIAPTFPRDDPDEARWRTLKIRVDAIGLAERVEPGLMFFVSLISERDLILLRGACVGVRLLAAEVRGEVAVARGVVRGRRTMGGAFAKRVIRSVGRAHTCCVISDGCCGV